MKRKKELMPKANKVDSNAVWLLNKITVLFGHLLDNVPISIPLFMAIDTKPKSDDL